MGHLLDLPVEILLIICQNLKSIDCLAGLSRCCVRLRNVIFCPDNRENILRSLIFDDVLSLPQNPDQAWFQAHYAREPMWVARNADLPGELTHAETRKFLATTGVPSHSLDMIQFSSSFARFVRDDDEDSLDDDDDEDSLDDWRPMLDSHNIFYRAKGQGSEETKFYFDLGTTPCGTLKVDAQDGHVVCEDRSPLSTEQCQLDVASSVSSFLVMMGMAGMIFYRIGWPVIHIGPPDSEELKALRKYALRMLWTVFEDYDHNLTCSFWIKLFERCGEIWNDLEEDMIC